MNDFYRIRKNVNSIKDNLKKFCTKYEYDFSEWILMDNWYSITFTSNYFLEAKLFVFERGFNEIYYHLIIYPFPNTCFPIFYKSESIDGWNHITDKFDLYHLCEHDKDFEDVTNLVKYLEIITYKSNENRKSQFDKELLNKFRREKIEQLSSDMKDRYSSFNMSRNTVDNLKKSFIPNSMIDNKMVSDINMSIVDETN